MRHRISVVSAVLAMALFGAACGGGSTGGGSGGGGASSGGPSETPSTSSASGATLQQGTGNKLVFSPTSLSVATGTTITVTNVSSSTAHTFTIRGKGINVVNQAGKSATVKISLPPGTYPFICTFHVSLGMKGTLTVTG